MDGTTEDRKPEAAPAAAGARHTLEAEGLFKTYKGRTVVRGVTIRVDKGEVVGLLGPNGAAVEARPNSFKKPAAGGDAK